MPSLKSVLVEVDESQHQTIEGVFLQMGETGFSLESREHGEMFEEDPWASTFNLIWVRAGMRGKELPL